MTIFDELTALQVTSIEDKKNLCLACKALNLLVTPLLYKDMVIGITVEFSFCEHPDGHPSWDFTCSKPTDPLREQQSHQSRPHP
jgi:hypothetical protein